MKEHQSAHAGFNNRSASAFIAKPAQLFMSTAPEAEESLFFPAWAEEDMASLCKGVIAVARNGAMLRQCVVITVTGHQHFWPESLARDSEWF